MGYRYNTSETKLVDYTEKLPIDLMMKVMAQDNDIKTNTLKGLNELSALIPNKTFKQWQPELTNRTKIYEDEISRISKEFASGKNVMGQLQALSATLNKDVKSGKLNSLVAPYQSLMSEYADKKKEKDINEEDLNLAYQYAYNNPGDFYYDPETKSSPTVSMDAIAKRFDANKYLGDTIKTEAMKQKLEGMGIEQYKDKDGKEKFRYSSTFSTKRLDPYHLQQYSRNSEKYLQDQIKNVAEAALLSNSDYNSDANFQAKFRAGKLTPAEKQEYLKAKAENDANIFAAQFSGTTQELKAGNMWKDEGKLLQDEYAKMKYKDELENKPSNLDITANGVAVYHGEQQANGNVVITPKYLQKNEAHINGQMSALMREAQTKGLDTTGLASGDFTTFMKVNQGKLPTEVNEYKTEMARLRYEKQLNSHLKTKVGSTGQMKGIVYEPSVTMEQLDKKNNQAEFNSIMNMDEATLLEGIRKRTVVVRKNGKVLSDKEVQSELRGKEEIKGPDGKIIQEKVSGMGSLRVLVGNDADISRNVEPTIQLDGRTFDEKRVVTGGRKEKKDSYDNVTNEATGIEVSIYGGAAKTKGGRFSQGKIRSAKINKMNYEMKNAGMSLPQIRTNDGTYDYNSGTIIFTDKKGKQSTVSEKDKQFDDLFYDILELNGYIND